MVKKILLVLSLLSITAAPLLAHQEKTESHLKTKSAAIVGGTFAISALAAWYLLSSYAKITLDNVCPLPPEMVTSIAEEIKKIPEAIRFKVIQENPLLMVVVIKENGWEKLVKPVSMPGSLKGFLSSVFGAGITFGLWPTKVHELFGLNSKNQEE